MCGDAFKSVEGGREGGWFYGKRCLFLLRCGGKKKKEKKKKKRKKKAKGESLIFWGKGGEGEEGF